MSRLFAALGIALLALGLAAPLAAAAADPIQVRLTGIDPTDYPNVHAVASITDAAGRPIDGLSTSDIIVSEEGRAQRATLAPVAETRPVALVLALDVSGSMAGTPLANAKAAMTQLVASLRPIDSAAIITFNASVTLAQPLTSDKAALAAAIAGARADGNTAIFDALDRSIDVLAPVDAKARRAVVLLTDGADNSSTRSIASVIDKLRAQRYPLYVVGLGTSLEEGVLQALAGAGTGGGLSVAPTSAQLAGIYAALAQEIRVQYDVAYRSDAARAAGSQLTLTVQVVRAGTVVGSGTITFVVPAGHGAAAPVAPTDVVIPSTALLPPRPDRIDPVVLGLLGSATMLCLLLWVSTAMESRQLALLATDRLGRYVGVDARGVTARPPFLSRTFRPALMRGTAPLGRLAPRSVLKGTARKLAQSGGALSLTASELVGMRIGLAFVLGVAAALLASFVQPDLRFIALVGLIGLLFGYLVPGLWLDSTIRARQHRILRALPSALDLLALSASAGMTFDGAVGQVAQRWKGPLSDELRQLLVEFNMGRDRRVALRALGERTGVPEVARFANAVLQADALGTPMSRVLEEQAVEMRTRRRQRAEESARKAPVKMLFPMVGLIFPALFVVILGPAVPRFIDLFQQVH